MDEKLLKEREALNRQIAEMIETVCAKVTDPEVVAKCEAGLLALAATVSRDPTELQSFIRKSFSEARAKRGRN